MTFVPGTVDVSELINGHSLRVVLYPDESLGFYTEATVECFQLPNVVIIGDRFWGSNDCSAASDEHPLPPGCNWDLTRPGSYIYNNFTDLVVNSSYLSGMVRIYKASKYRQIRFVTVADFRLLWDSESDDDPAAIEKEIEQGKRFKFALLDEQDVWNIHPIDLATYLKKSRQFRIDTPKNGYPEILRDPDFIAGLAAKFAEVDDYTAGINDQPFYLSRYRVTSEGHYQHQIGGELVTKEYRHLKVFCEA